MLDLLAGFDLPRTVVLTKTDKLKPRKLHAVTREITATLLSLGHGPRQEWGVRGGDGAAALLCTSASRNEGIDELRTSVSEAASSSFADQLAG